MSHLLLAFALLLQAVPQVNWKSEVRQDADGNRIVLTGELDPGIDHVSGTVTYMPCKGDACYMPVDWDFEEFFDLSSESSSAGSADVSLRETPPTATQWAPPSYGAEGGYNPQTRTVDSP